VNTARALVDFGQPPGVSSAATAAAARRAIRDPFDRWLTAVQQRDLLERHYDQIARAYDERLRDARVVLSVRTRDEFDHHGRRRPPIGLLSRCETPSSPPGPATPPGCDPLFPSEILVSTADRALGARVADVFESIGQPVVENYPRLLPEGSVPARTMIKHFFWRVRAAYERLNPPDAARPGRELVWRMLLDPERRSGDGELLRGYLHRLQRPPRELQASFSVAHAEYQRIADFVRAHHDSLVESCCRAPERLSVLVIEIRKDLVWRSVEGPFGGPRPEGARIIARTIARAVSEYLADRRTRASGGVDDATFESSDEPRRIAGE